MVRLKSVFFETVLLFIKIYIYVDPCQEVLLSSAQLYQILRHVPLMNYTVKG